MITFTYDAAGQMLALTDPLGRTTSYTYNSLGLLDSLTDALGNVTTYDYDNRGNLTTLTLPTVAAGTPVYSYSYDSLSRLVSETDPLGGVLAYGYDAAGQLLTFTDQLNRTTSYAYDNLGLLETETDALGNVTSYGYDLSGNMTSVTDALGNTTTYAYDALARNTSITDALSGVVSFGYDAVGQLTSQIDQLGNTTSYSYDDVGQLLSVSDPLYNTTSYAYDAVGNLLSTTDALGSTTSYDYDALYRNTSITDALGGVISLDYDAAGQFLSETDQLGRTTSYAYDDLGQMTAMTNPAGGVTGYAYDALGSLVTLTDALGNETTYDYDLLGQTTSITDALGSATGQAYNAAGELTSETNVLGQTTSYGYDLLGRRTTITDSLGNVTTNAYDPVGNLTGVTDPLAQTTSYAYDELHRLISETDANGGVVAYTYDAASNMLSLTDPGGNTTSWTYDALHRAIQETNELGFSRYFAYDAVGNLTERTDRNGRIREFVYDALHRLTQERWIDGAATVNTIDFSYDAASQLTAASDAVSAYAYEYNNLGLITQVDNLGTSVGPHAILDYTFDALGNKTSLVATIDGVADFQNTYSYDALSRMASVQQTHSDPLATGVLPVSDKRVDFSYNALGQFTSIDRYADLAGTELVVSSDYTYDSASRLTALDHAQGATTLAAYTWTFDDLDRITQATSPDGTSDYTYDATGQLTGATNSFAADENYSYDENGNRNMSGYTVGTNNQILSDGTYNYDYDAEGNRTKQTDIATGEVTEYDYDHLNRLVRITERSSDGGPVTKQVDYTYDLLGRRLAKHIDNDGDGTVDEEDFYVYDGQRHERGNAGDHIILAFNESGDLTNRYLHGPAVDQILADEQLVDELVDEVLYPLTDQLGSVRDLAVYDQSTGDTTIANHIVYDSFGQILSETDSSIDHLFAYTGRERDEESDLQFNRARPYDPGIGQWISEDPIGFHAGDANTRRYVGNQVLTKRDPSGLYDEAGHFYTTWAVAVIVGYNREDALRLAVFSQLPDEVDDFEATPMVIEGLKKEASKVVHPLLHPEVRSGFWGMCNDAFDAFWEFRAPGEGRTRAKRTEAELQQVREHARRSTDYYEQLTSTHAHSLHGGGPAKVALRKRQLGDLIADEKSTWRTGFLIHALGDAFAHTYVGKDGKRHAFKYPEGHALYGTLPDIIPYDFANYSNYVDSLADALARRNCQR